MGTTSAILDGKRASRVMCTGIALAWNNVPTEMKRGLKLRRRVYQRDGKRELWFFYDDKEPKIPVRRDGELEIVRWGNGRKQSRHLGLPVAVLCPTHNAMFDLGVATFRAYHSVTIYGTAHRLALKHRLTSESLDYHNERIAGKHGRNLGSIES